MARLDEIKAAARQRIHGCAAVSASYVDEDHPSGLIFAEDYDGEGLLVRYHSKIDRTGDLDGQYGEVIDGIDRIVFLDQNVADVTEALEFNGEPALVLSRGAVVTIQGYKGLQFVLDSQEPPDGPEETVWVVARRRG
jgi:hypothetical protein